MGNICHMIRVRKIPWHCESRRPYHENHLGLSYQLHPTLNLCYEYLAHQWWLIQHHHEIKILLRAQPLSLPEAYALVWGHRPSHKSKCEAEAQKELHNCQGVAHHLKEK